MNTPKTFSRREALRLGALGAGLLLTPRILRADTPPPEPKADGLEPMRLAFIGCGNQALTHIQSLTRHTYVAFADVDDRTAAKAYTEHPSVPRYRDFRQMLDRHAKDIDAVVIATPDHSHFTASLFALAHGKHIYVEKPLTTTVWEARQLARVAKKSGAKAQMGIQGHSMGGLRVLREWLDAGAVGPISEVILYTDRMQPARYFWSTEQAPAEPVPPELSWDLWLSGRPARPFNHEYVPERWRNWWDFGTGPIGNIGVHMLDVVEFCLELGYPDWVEGEMSAKSTQTAAPWARAQWHFKSRGARKQAVDIRWFDGMRNGVQAKPESIPHVPPAIIAATANAMAFVGPHGTVFIDDMRASTRPRIFPEAREKEFLAAPPKPTLPRPKGLHIDGLFRAIQSGGEPPANFGYSGPLTEVALLGNVAQRSGKRIKWNHNTNWPKGFAADHPLLVPKIAKEWMPGV
ncbi:Gfo/Idh/MocA family protein [Nibricoccus sp. IMCC34717]|uniref:Gfo/Idh/MocA family protein n=1 Tax=Nibricoccus sp. IMCC34717 TaxID=3034021 RepID=UPI00384F61CB